MAIFRSGVLDILRVRSLKRFEQGETVLEAGEIYDVVLNMDTVYIIRDKDGNEVLVPKESFEVAGQDPKK